MIPETLFIIGFVSFAIGLLLGLMRARKIKYQEIIAYRNMAYDDVIWKIERYLLNLSHIETVPLLKNLKREIQDMKEWK